MPKIINYDYATDALSPEERETRINAAIAELERNPNASRRGVARNHGLPESTLRGRMKKLRINYKSFNKDDRVGPLRDNFDTYSSVSPPAYSPPISTISSATTASQNIIYAQYYLQQQQLQQQQQQLQLQQQQRQLQQQAAAQQQHQQQQQHTNSTTVPVAFVPPYKPPPLAQFNIIEYHSKIDREYLPDLDDDTKELKPSTINTLPKKAIPIKILKSNLVKFDDVNFNQITTETTYDTKQRQQKLDECIEELTKTPHLTIKDVSQSKKIPESAIRRTLKENQTKMVEYYLSKEIELKVIEILRKFEFIQDVNLLKNMVNYLIDEFIKQDHYSQSGNLKEMLDKERTEEIIVDFLWKYSNVLIGEIKLRELI